jgi:hypothetical protein
MQAEGQDGASIDMAYRDGVAGSGRQLVELPIICCGTSWTPID